MATSDLTAERLRDLLNYDPATGKMTWRIKSAQRIKVGDEAGFIRGDGYVIVRLFNKHHLAHRLAWLHFYGRWPAMFIDHINGRKSANQISNLRDVSLTTNNQNVNAARKDSRSGVQGVRAVGGRFEARMRINGRRACLGFFASEAEAYAAYMLAKRERQPGFAG